MSILREISELNAGAVALLQQNETEHSKGVFIEALVRLQSLCHDDTGIFLRLQGSPHFYTCYSELLGSQNSSATSFAANELLDHEEAVQIYSQGFLLANDVPVSAAETTAVLLFNIGLAHHQEGLRTGKSAILRNALDLYEWSDSLVSLDTTEQHGLAPIVLKGALCHNMALCYSCFFQMDQFQVVVEKLSQIVRWMDSDEQIECAVVEFFRTSLFFAEFNDFRYAPSA